jgi:hypothetical protein
LEATIAVLNDLVDAGVIERYAVGGAVAEIYWAEPIDTTDLDVFVLLPPSAHPLAPLEDVYAYLRQRGHVPENEFIRIEGLPVQFLPAQSSSGLAKAALDNAVSQPYSPKIAFWLFTPEYLIALALELGRNKDFLRVLRLLDNPTAPPNLPLLRDLIGRFNLSAKWNTFVSRFPDHADALTSTESGG